MMFIIIYLQPFFYLRVTADGEDFLWIMAFFHIFLLFLVVDRCSYGKYLQNLLFCEKKQHDMIQHEGELFFEWTVPLRLMECSIPWFLVGSCALSSKKDRNWCFKIAVRVLSQTSHRSAAHTKISCMICLCGVESYGSIAVISIELNRRQQTWADYDNWGDHWCSLWGQKQ